jgi:redox-sensitive bicupin YhaK (pirin superfamily)
MSNIKQIITPREKDLGDFTVRRVLPYVHQRMVGPFIFFDHMGPADFAVGKAMNVRPHPHINLATVTYLFEGKFEHRDSLGSDQIIEPGAINWMTAGKGIVHSERTPPDMIKTGGRLHGIQLWVALPEEFEEIEASFVHHPKNTLPEFEVGGVKIKLLLGKAFEKQSPVQVFSDLFYIEAQMPKGTQLTLPKAQEAAAYVVKGELKVEDQTLAQGSMLIAQDNTQPVLIAEQDCHVMLLGGSVLGPRFMYWNFISSSKERLEEAKQIWKNGPHASSPRFTPIPDDNSEFIPLPLD